MPYSSKVLLAKLLLVHKVIELLHLAHGQSGETWLAFFDSQRGLNFDEEKRCARLFSNVLQHEGLKYMGVIQAK